MRWRSRTHKSIAYSLVPELAEHTGLSQQSLGALLAPSLTWHIRVEPAKLEQSMKIGTQVQFCMLNKVRRGSHLTDASVAANCGNFGHVLLQIAIEARICAVDPYKLGVSTLGNSTTSY